MRIYIDEYKNLKNKDHLTLTIGNFDGIHVGHQALIKKAASFYDTKPALMTFDPHPARLLRDVKHQRLMSINQKIEILNKTVLDRAYIVKFTKEFADLTPDEYIDFLKKLNVKRIVVGNDFKFGAFAKGTILDLEKHFEVVVVDDILINQTRVSSTYIKDLIYSGELDKVYNLLNRYYQIEGFVIHGDKVGRTLGIPTANLDYDDYVLPKDGVYYSIVELNGKEYAGALNIGYNPTINHSKTKRAEVHILDFDEEIYDQELKIKIVKFLRPELKFQGKDELVKQMQEDLRQCRELYSLEKNF